MGDEAGDGPGIGYSDALWSGRWEECRTQDVFWEHEAGGCSKGTVVFVETGVSLQGKARHCTARCSAVQCSAVAMK